MVPVSPTLPVHIPVCDNAIPGQDPGSSHVTRMSHHTAPVSPMSLCDSEYGAGQALHVTITTVHLYVIHRPYVMCGKRSSMIESN